MKKINLIIFWLFLFVFIFLLMNDVKWLSFLILFVASIIRGKETDKQYNKIYIIKNKVFFKNMKLISMLIGMSVFMYVIYSIVIGDYSYLSNIDLMMKFVLLIASPIIAIILKYEIELYQYYKKNNL